MPSRRRASCRERALDYRTQKVETTGRRTIPRARETKQVGERRSRARVRAGARTAVCRRARASPAAHGAGERDRCTEQFPGRGTGLRPSVAVD
jgi:hypothetical protein